MKVQELIKKYEDACFAVVLVDEVLENLKQLDEQKAGHADEAPRYVKNILARLRELPVHDREVWLKAIMGEFEKDFSHAKWREGYEQGKFEGMVGREKVTIPQFVADWIEESRKTCKDVADFFDFDFTNEEVGKWFMQERPFDLVARAWLDGYEVEKEKRYLVKMKGIEINFNFLNRHRNQNYWIFSSKEENTLYQTQHTRKQLEDAGFGWVFDCPGVEVQEVE